MCPSVPPLARKRLACSKIPSGRPGTSLASVIVGSPLSAASMKIAPGVDGDRLPGHRVGAAHRDHHVGAIILVGRLFQERAGGRVLDLLGAEIGCGPRTLK